MDPQVRIKDADKVLRAFGKVRRQLPLEVTRELRSLGREVEAEARRLFTPISVGTAEGFTTSVSRLGRVRVRQRLKKTTGKHPEYGRTQMNLALLPALANKQKRIEQGLEQLVEKVIRDNGLS